MTLSRIFTAAIQGSPIMALAIMGEMMFGLSADPCNILRGPARVRVLNSASRRTILPGARRQAPLGATLRRSILPGTDRFRVLSAEACCKP